VTFIYQSLFVGTLTLSTASSSEASSSFQFLSSLQSCQSKEELLYLLTKKAADLCDAGLLDDQEQIYL